MIRKLLILLCLLTLMLNGCASEKQSRQLHRKRYRGKTVVKIQRSVLVDSFVIEEVDS